jgi:hypothetical protein
MIQTAFQLANAKLKFKKCQRLSGETDVQYVIRKFPDDSQREDPAPAGDPFQPQS